MNPKKDEQKATSPRNNASAAYNTTMPNQAVVSKSKKKKSRKTAKRHVLVRSGIYRHVREETYHERPTINGKRTWRSLGVDFTPQTNFKAAEYEYHRRRTMENEGKNPYAADPAGSTLPAYQKQTAVMAKTVGEIIRRYIADGLLDRHLLTRPDSTEQDERRNCDTLMKFWEPVPGQSLDISLYDLECHRPSFS